MRVIALLLGFAAGTFAQATSANPPPGRAGVLVRPNPPLVPVGQKIHVLCQFVYVREGFYCDSAGKVKPVRPGTPNPWQRGKCNMTDPGEGYVCDPNTGKVRPWFDVGGGTGTINRFCTQILLTAGYTCDPKSGVITVPFKISPTTAGGFDREFCAKRGVVCWITTDGAVPESVQETNLDLQLERQHRLAEQVRSAQEAEAMRREEAERQRKEAEDTRKRQEAAQAQAQEDANRRDNLREKADRTPADQQLAQDATSANAQALASARSAQALDRRVQEVQIRLVQAVDAHEQALAELQRRNQAYREVSSQVSALIGQDDQRTVRAALAFQAQPAPQLQFGQEQVFPRLQVSDPRLRPYKVFFPADGQGPLPLIRTKAGEGHAPPESTLMTSRLGWHVHRLALAVRTAEPTLTLRVTSAWSRAAGTSYGAGIGVDVTVVGASGNIVRDPSRLAWMTGLAQAVGFASGIVEDAGTVNGHVHLTVAPSPLAIVRQYVQALPER